jgi:hypothetical protein
MKKLFFRLSIITFKTEIPTLNLVIEEIEQPKLQFLLL